MPAKRQLKKPNPKKELYTAQLTIYGAARKLSPEAKALFVADFERFATNFYFDLDMDALIAVALRKTELHVSVNVRPGECAPRSSNIVSLDAYRAAKNRSRIEASPAA